MNLPFQNDALGKLTLRLTVGILILFHGVYKILNPGSLDFISTLLANVNLPQILAYGVYLGEVVAPLMVILGIFSRIGGLLIFGNTIFAIALDIAMNYLHSLTMVDMRWNYRFSFYLQGLRYSSSEAADLPLNPIKYLNT